MLRHEPEVIATSNSDLPRHMDTSGDRRLPVIDVYDFFSGCGGTSAGLRNAGMNPRLALDIDAEALNTYSRNFASTATIVGDIRRVSTRDVERYFDATRVRPVLISACAPCQPFSRQNRQKRECDGRADLLSELHRFVIRFRPELLFIENVPGLQRDPDAGTGPLARLLRLLTRLGYWHHSSVLRAQDFGVPQNRRRLIVVASAFGPISLPAPTHGTPDAPHVTVRDAIGTLPPLEAGETDESIANHRASALSVTNLARIRSTKPGGSWKAWQDSLRLSCHEGVGGYTDVYGRMAWDRPAPSLTTRCISLSNGRFGHPEQDRALSIREAAYLQSFDPEFEFVGSVNGMARQIGNAVPVRLAHAVGEELVRHVAVYLGDNG